MRMKFQTRWVHRALWHTSLEHMQGSPTQAKSMIGKQGGKQTITSAAYVFLVVILGILGYGAALES